MKHFKSVLSVLALILASTFVYAEHTAPVYDVDSMSTDSLPNNSNTDNSPKPTNAPLSASLPPATIEQRVAKLEQQLENSQQNELGNRLNSAQGEIQALRAQVEELSHQLQELRSHRELRSDLDSTELNKAPSKDLTEQSMSALPRESDEENPTLNKSSSLSKETSKRMENSAQSTVKNSETSSLGLEGERRTGAKLSSNERSNKKTLLADVPTNKVEQPNTVEEQAVYQTAYNLIKVKKYNDAIASLQKMLLKYPSGQFAANAHYWLGELYSLTGENEQAAAEFSAVVKHYPTNPRVADAELKLGLINASLLKWPAAKATFKKIIAKYPGTPSARLAMEQLKLLKQAGH